ncbi:hypothetical protein D3C86_1618620 [compost metagenome]
MVLQELYDKRKQLIDTGYDLESDEVLEVEHQISNAEYLPSFEEVIEAISSGRMKSIFS